MPRPYRPPPASPSANPEEQDAGRPPTLLRRGSGVAWFGLRSFWGHLAHLAASGIATEDIDSRDWMVPDAPGDLLDTVARRIAGSAVHPAETLTGALGRDLWLDFVADTGDDIQASEAVARMLFREYELPDPERPGEHLEAPRGDVLLFGGDTAYPVATAHEIQNRVVAPFNRVLLERRDGRRRVLLGVPGNHDWYDGLDGFGRLFRRREGGLSPEQLAPSTTEERGSQFFHAVEWAEKLVLGKRVEKRNVLVLDGYVPVQAASYFALPLAPRLDLYGVDRQLRGIDFRQQRFFASRRQSHAVGEQDRVVLLVLPDPVYPFYEPSPTGVAMVEALEADVDRVPHLVLSGDIHHYERRQVGRSLHVTAGGGGAFLHPSVPPPRGAPVAAAQWPSVRASWALLWQVPWRVALGRAGFLPHLGFLAVFGPTLAIAVRWLGSSLKLTTIFAGLLSAVVLALMGGVRLPGKRLRVLALAAAAGVVMGGVPAIVTMWTRHALRTQQIHLSQLWALVLTLVLASFAGAFAFGAFVAGLTWLGLERTQAFASLGLPAYRHFVRLRVRTDGTVDGWVVGSVDPVRDKGERPVLVDSWTFRLPPADGGTGD